MRKRWNWILIIAVIIVTVAFVLWNGIQKGLFTASPNDVPECTGIITPTSMSESVVTNTPMPIATKVPTSTPTATPAPTATNTPTPTNTPVPTPTPMPTSTPVPTPTNTPTPTSTPTPTPTNTPIPTPAVELLKTVQMGDDVYYKFYEEGILVVTGTGSTWDFEDFLTRNEQVDAISGVIGDGKTYAGTEIIIEEGISRIGEWALSYYASCKKVIIPSSLAEISDYGFGYCGCETVVRNGCETEWIGLDFSRLTVGKHAFVGTTGLTDVEEANPYTATPTPLPTATPTPTPNPEQPKLLESVKGGENVTYEFWDNHVIKIKGTGGTYDMFYWGDAVHDAANKYFFDGFHTISVEEGITYLGSFSWDIFGGDYDTYYLYLPSTLKEMHRNGLSYSVTVTGYRNGEQVSFEYSTRTVNDEEKFVEFLGITFR